MCSCVCVCVCVCVVCVRAHARACVCVGACVHARVHVRVVVYVRVQAHSCSWLKISSVKEPSPLRQSCRKVVEDALQQQFCNIEWMAKVWDKLTVIN
jgi:hypothetical protein